MTEHDQPTLAECLAMLEPWSDMPMYEDACALVEGEFMQYGGWAAAALATELGEDYQNIYRGFG